MIHDHLSMTFADHLRLGTVFPLPAEDRACACADCASGTIPSVAGPGCSLPAHEYTEAGGLACWNCGALTIDL